MACEAREATYDQLCAAKQKLCDALAAVHPIKLGDRFQRTEPWNGNTVMVEVDGFRLKYGRELSVLGAVLKKDGTPGARGKEISDLKQWTPLPRKEA